MKPDRPRDSAKSSRYEVREAHLSNDRQAILDLWALKEGGDPLDETKLDWFYEANPAGKGWAFFLVDRASEDPVGVIGSIPRKFTGTGGTLTGAVMVDLIIHKAHRTLGPGLLLQREASAIVKERVDFLYSFPNVRSGALRKKTGFNEHRELRQLVCPVDLGAYLAVSVPRVIRALPSIVYRRALIVIGKLSSLGMKSTDEMLPEFADALQDDSVQGTGNYSGDRSFECLKWRLLDHPVKDIRYFCQADRKGRPRGYIAWTRPTNGKVNVTDFAIAPGHPPRKLFGAFMCKMASDNATSVALEVDATRQSVIRTLGWLGFYDRGKTDVYIMRGNENAAGDWLPRLVLSRYDSDN